MLKVEHFFDVYEKHFSRFRNRPMRLLEIGINKGGSMSLWRNYFGEQCEIHGLDIDPCTRDVVEDDITVHIGSQGDPGFLTRIAQEYGPFDLIIDDGSHINNHVIESFRYLFPKLKKGGIYVVEDTQTSYWEDYGGNSNNLNDNSTIYGFFKALIDGLNHEEFILDSYQKTYYDKHIVSMHFYHNMIFIYKGDNDEASNFIVKNKKPDV